MAVLPMLAFDRLRPGALKRRRRRVLCARAERHLARAWADIEQHGVIHEVRSAPAEALQETKARFVHVRDELEQAEQASGKALALCPGDEPVRGLQARILKAKADAFNEIPSQRAVMAALGSVAFGTTGVCNASCIHCPTGKTATDHVPRIEMPLPLLRKILAGFRKLDLAIWGQISFGLFGDGLVDRQVVKRARMVREFYPETPLTINTNGAAFDARKHGQLKDLGAVLALHVESINPETYNRLMAPLRLERVMSKLEELLACFGESVFVSVPVSRLNVDEIPEMKKFFLGRGAGDITFTPLSNRCQDDQTVFRSLALSPVKIQCLPSLLDDVIVDCDGKVLMCCQDFQRREPIGDFSKQTVEEVLSSVERYKARQRFAALEHDAYSSCSSCYADTEFHNG